MKSLKQLLLPAMVVPGLLVACGAQETGPVFDAARITAHVRTLASDEYEGRAPTTAGEEKTVAYLIGQLQQAGLAPGGDLQADGSRAYTQDVPLLRTRIDGDIDIRVRSGGVEQRWTPAQQVTVRAALTGADEVDLADLPVVFVGYGVSAPERDWDDFKGIDLAGKVALVLVNDPDYETGSGDFGGKAMTYYGRWTYKYEELARRGAAGALVIHEDEPASYGWETVKNSHATDMFDVLRADPQAAHVPLEGWVQRDAAVALLADAGLDFEALKKQAQTRAFQPVQLPGVGFSAHFAVARDEVVTHNVMGVVHGASHPDEWVLYTAHWDHLGVGEPDERGDTLYNGALDNAAGVAQLLEIARATAQGAPPQRSVGFLFVTAEERGLLGSEYYASAPLYPLETTVAVLNTDSPLPSPPSQDFSTTGEAPSTLQDLLVQVAASKGVRYTPEKHPEAGLFYRSDHFSFAKRGVPALSYESGTNLIKGGRRAGEAWSKAFMAGRYHQPSDEFDEATWNSDGIARHAVVLHAMGQELANSRTWPEWKLGAEFKAAREASASQRR